MRLLHNIWNEMLWITKLWGFLSIIYLIGSFFNLVPRIYFEQHRIDSIKPYCINSLGMKFDVLRHKDLTFIFI